MVKTYLFIVFISQFNPVQAQSLDGPIGAGDNLLFNEKSRINLPMNENYGRSDSGKLRRKSIFKTASIALAYTGTTYFVYRTLDTRVMEESQRHKPAITTFISNSVSGLGLGRTQAIGLGASAAFAFLAGKKKLQKTVIIWGGSLVINSTITDQLKKSFQRHRPNTGDAYNVFDWKNGPKIHKSFPSAHTSNAFTTAAVFATVYKENKWVPPVAYGLATLVGLSRIYDNAHWSSDVLTGAAVGFLSAKLMFHAYEWAGKKFTFLPNIGSTYSSISIICSL